MKQNVLLENMTWEEVLKKIEEGYSTAIIPIGSVEQHGPHLPLGTDTYVAMTIAEDAATKTKSIVIPPIWCGFSPHHMVLPGTITIRPEILIEFLYDVVQSLALHGLKNFVLLNGHRLVNISWMQIAAERLKRTLKVNVIIFDPAFMSKEIIPELGFGSIGHADAIESSHMWARYPQLVKMEKAIDFGAPSKPLYHVDPAASEDTLCYVPSSLQEASVHVHESKGVSGFPTQSDIDKGKIYHQHLVNRLIAVINSFKS